MMINVLWEYFDPTYDVRNPLNNVSINQKYMKSSFYFLCYYDKKCNFKLDTIMILTKCIDGLASYILHRMAYFRSVSYKFIFYTRKFDEI